MMERNKVEEGKRRFYRNRKQDMRHEDKVLIVPNDLQRQFSLYADEYERKAIEVLRSGRYILGQELEAFESEWAEYVGSKYCVGLGNGFDALWITFRLLGIGVGDDVIVCSNAYIACVMGITINGATPIFVEPDEYDNIDADKIEEAITLSTRAILAVHLYGQACNMSQIMNIAKKYDLRVVEDCAQSHGSHWNGRKVGTFGDVGCFSFYPSKGCGAFGDGGCIVTGNRELAEKFKIFRNYGSERRYYNQVIGCNSRLDEIQAGLLRVKLSHLDELNQERRKIAESYLKYLDNPLLQLPKIRPGADSTWHQFVVHCKFRDELRKYLERRGIESLIHYPIPPHLSEAYRYLGKRVGDYPIAEKYADEVLSLPIYNGMTEKEQNYIISCINHFSLPISPIV